MDFKEIIVLLGVEINEGDCYAPSGCGRTKSSGDNFIIGILGSASAVIENSGARSDRSARIIIVLCPCSDDGIT